MTTLRTTLATSTLLGSIALSSAQAETSEPGLPAPGSTAPPNVEQWPVPEAAQSTPRADAPRSVVLTVSGGISLGSYEAGLNWALLRLFKASASAPEQFAGTRYALRSMTGASAGNINAFVGAIEWFDPVASSNGAGTSAAESNLFWDAWIPFGIDQLFPQGQRCEQYKKVVADDDLDCEVDTPYRADDGIFSRRGFARIMYELRGRLALTYQPSTVRFPIGVTVTKSVPEPVHGKTLASLDVKTQRFAVLLEAGIDRQGHLVFYQRRAKDSGLVGNQLYLPSIGGRVDNDDVLRVIQASSAFPAAFGPIKLEYCLEGQLQGEDCNPHHVKRDERSPRSAWFLDGGLFDNLPLGLALDTLELDPSEMPALPADAEPPDAPILMYLNPSLRRRLDIPEEANGESPRGERGFNHLVDLVGRFISVARNYELQSNIRYGNVRIDALATSRYLPIFGGYLGAFAGFLARPFREFDYGVGVYDALYLVGSMSCAKDLGWAAELKGGSEVQLAACVGRKVIDLSQRIGVASGSASDFVVRRTLASELGDMTSSAGQLARVHEADPELARLGNTAAPDVVLEKLHRGMLAVRREHVASGREPQFGAVLDAIGLTAADLTGHTQMTPSETALFTNREALLGQLAKNIAQRMVTIEDEEWTRTPKKDRRELGQTVAGSLQFATEVYFNGQEYSPDLIWSPSTVPDGAGWPAKAFAAITPHFATASIIRGGAELGYLPTYFGANGWAITAPLAPVSWSRKDLTLGFRAGPSLAMTRRYGLLSRAELGVYAFGDYGTTFNGSLEQFALGPELALQLFYNRVRVSANWDVLAFDENDHAMHGKAWTIRAGISDLNGMAYWAMRALF